MKILILAGSPRKNGNSYKLVEAFKEGAAKHDITVVPVGNMKINGCLACEYCHTQGNGKCIQNDDMQQIHSLLAEAEMIVLASPVYYWGLSGQLQSCLTRWYAPHRPAKASKYAVLLANGSECVYDGIEAQMKACLPYCGGEILGIIKTSMEKNNLQEACAAAKALGARL